ncbi:MAG: tail fiber protein [Victivallaceae bacterium]|nr:tail fiber protein [Victivallaceae bacterium]
MEGYIGQIKIFAGNYAPVDWAFCDGQALQIQEYMELYSLFGTTYGGDGTTTFGLPDLRGRIPVHLNTAAQWQLGNQVGNEQETLSVTQIPSHIHPMQASNHSRSIQTVEGSMVCNTSPINFYKNQASSPDKETSLSPEAVDSTGNGLPHYNLMPYLCINFIVCLKGVYPLHGL